MSRTINKLLQDNSLKQQTATEPTAELIQTETQLDNATPSSPSVPDMGILSIGLLGLCLLGIALLLKVIVLKVTAEHKQVVATLKHIDKVPCKSCQFFSYNSYLKCAVRPSQVLTDAAIDCPDYCPKKSAK
jgi:hypothetical protein